MLGENGLEKLFNDKKRKATMSRSKKKNELMIDNNSSLMIEKLGNNIKKTIINKSIVYEKWSMGERKKDEGNCSQFTNRMLDFMI